MDIGFKERAEILNLDNELLFALKCKRMGKLGTATAFVGMGQLSGDWTLQLVTRVAIDPDVYPEGETKVRYNGKIYILTNTERYDSRPLKGKRERTETVLYLR